MNHKLDKTTALAICALLLGAILIAYWPVRTHDFINFDDPDYVSANPVVQSGLTLESVRWAFASMHASNWHPITWLSHMLDCQLFGLNAGAHHQVSVGFHAANAMLLFLLLVRTTGAIWRCAIVAGLFALHPLRVESVAWIAERKDVLSAFFGLLTLHAYVRYVHSQRETPSTKVSPPDWHSWSWYGVALICFALGLMSKPMLVTWPFVMLLLDVWPLQRLSSSAGRILASPQLGRLIAEKIPFFVLAIASCVITVIVQRGSGATVPLEALPGGARLANVCASYLRYLGKTLWPDSLVPFYPFGAIGWDQALPFAGLAALLGLGVWTILQLRTKPFLAVGWFWFVGTLVPVIGLVQVGRQSIADRYTYLPQIGLLVALVWMFAEFCERITLPRPLRTVLAIALVAVCSFLTIRQVDHWHNTLTLAQHSTRVTAGNYIAHAQLAMALTLDNQLTEALAECRKALELRPTFAEAHNTMGTIRLREGRLQEALACFQEAARHDPTYPDAYHGMADVYFKEGRFAEAESAAREAVRLWPTHLGGHYILASALHNQGRWTEAIAAYRRLQELKPDFFSAHRNLGNALVAQGDLPAAAHEFRRALEIQPHNPDVHNALALILLSQKNSVEASNHFARALSAQPTNGIANYQIALLLDGAGRRAQAIPHYRAALAANPDLPDVLNNLAWLLATSADTGLRNGSEAVYLAQRACTLTDSNEPQLLGTLAAAYAEAGQFPEAVSTAEKARDQARKMGNPEVAERNGQLLDLYRAGRPYHGQE